MEIQMVPLQTIFKTHTSLSDIEEIGKKVCEKLKSKGFKPTYGTDDYFVYVSIKIEHRQDSDIYYEIGHMLYKYTRPTQSITTKMSIILNHIVTRAESRQCKYYSYGSKYQYYMSYLQDEKITNTLKYSRR